MFSPVSEQYGIYLAISVKLCVQCIGKIDAGIAEINKQKDTTMKQFNASEFISNQETPVVDKSGEKVEIISTKARGDYSVLGYVGTTAMLYRWSPSGHYYAESPLHDDRNLFFDPKLEVVHVFKLPDGELVTTVNRLAVEAWKRTQKTIYLGTITGPIVPPEKSEVAK